MAKNVDVNRKELEEFIQALMQFQRVTTEKFRMLEQSWSKCDESWRGVSKQQFTNDFQKTRASVQESLKNGAEATKWLQRFNEIVKRFERI